MNGETLEEVERNIMEALRFHLEGMRDNGETIPQEFEGDLHSFRPFSVQVPGFSGGPAQFLALFCPDPF